MNKPNCPPLDYLDAVNALHDLAMLEGRGCAAANTLLQARATLFQLRAELERVKGRCEALIEDWHADVVLDEAQGTLNRCAAALRSVVDGAGGE